MFNWIKEHVFEMVMGAFLTIALLLLLFLLSIILDPMKCNTSTFECRKIQFDQCMKTELYSRPECINLIGTNGS